MKIRPAVIADAETLANWHNDPLTRSMSRRKGPFSHERYLALCDRLRSDSPNMFIAERAGIPVATYRIDDHEISYMVAPEHRRRGIATEMLKMAAQRHGSLTAEIYPHNVASIRAAEKAGMVVVLLEMTEHAA